MRQPFFLLVLFFPSLVMPNGNPEAATGADTGELVHTLDDQPRSEALLKEHLRAFRDDPGNTALQLEIGLDYMYLADPSRWGFLEQACSFFRKVQTRHGEDPFVLMYLGRSIGAKALDEAPQTLKRLKWAREGFKYMDRAVSLDGENAHLRLLRGEAQLYAHPILRRGSRLDADAETVRAFTGSDGFQELSDYQKARIHLFLGNYLQKRNRTENEIHDHWQATITLARNTPLGVEALARLEGTYVHLGYDKD